MKHQQVLRTALIPTTVALLLLAGSLNAGDREWARFGKAVTIMVGLDLLHHSVVAHPHNNVRVQYTHDYHRRRHCYRDQRRTVVVVRKPVVVERRVVVERPAVRRVVVEKPVVRRVRVQHTPKRSRSYIQPKDKSSLTGG